MTAPATLAEIRSDAEGRTYPRALLSRCDNALVLFAAGFHGRQDAYWIADAELRATCVDHDANLLGEMEAVYPVDWQFVNMDAFEFAEKTGEMWDLVSVDCPSNLFTEAAAQVQLWCDLARVAVVLGTGVSTSVLAPDGWEITQTRKRSSFLGGVFWTVLEHA